MDNKVIDMDGNKDDTKHGSKIVQEYANKKNRILREINKKAINISPKILDRSCPTHILKNTGYQLGGFVGDKG